MFVIVFFLVGLFLIIAQTTVFMINPVWDGAPDLYFVLVAYLAYRHDILRSLIILFSLSMLFDVLSGLVLGMYPALFILGFFFLKLMSDRLPVRESYYQVPMIGVGFLLVHWLVYVCMSFAVPSLLVPWSWPKMFIRAGLVIFFAFPLFRFFEYINRRLQGNFTGFSKGRLRSGNRYRE